MNYAKTFCKANSVVSAIPAGLQLKLQYSEHGVLQDFRIGFKPNLDPMSEVEGLKFNHDELLKKIKGFVPQVISTKGGTTWVFGVLYTDNIPTVEGKLPEGLYQNYIDDLMKGGQYKFYAGYAKSLAIQLNGSLIIRNFLTNAKFNLLPQIIVPATMKEETMNALMDDSYPFNKPFVAGYIIYEDIHCRYASDTLFQIKVSNDPKLIVSEDGFWKASIVSESGDAYIFNYSSILHNNIKKGSILLAEKDSVCSALSIRATRMKTGAQLVPKSTPDSVKCPICGKVNAVGVNNTPYQCDDPHCLSHQYIDVQKMLKVFGLVELNYDEYVDLVKDKTIQCMTDVLALPKYKDIEIKTSLANALSAVVPTSAAPNSDILERFANKCNNSAETVCYYLDNPLRIETDLDIVDPIIRRFVSWLEDPYNVSTVKTILDIVKIEARKKKFEGDPIFRGNSFVLTGRFRRGDYQEIASILESYDAKVMPSFEQGEKLPNAVITGSLNDGISGQVIQKARLHNVPIVDEDDFFTRYEIDDDLARNLL